MTRPRWLAIGVAVVATLLVFAIAHHAIVKFVVSRALGLASGTTVRFADLSIGTSHASFTGVHVTIGGTPLADVARIDVDYDLRAALPGGAHPFGLRDVSIERPVVTLERRRDATFNIAPLIHGGGGSGGGPTPRLRARVRDGELRIVDDAPLVPDLREQTVVGIDVDANVDPTARTTARLVASIVARRTRAAPLREYPLAVRATIDARRGYAATRATAAEIPLRGLVDFLIHAPVARFDDGVVDHVDVLAYQLGDSGVGLGGGADLSDARISVTVLDHPVADLGGHLDLFGDGVTTTGLHADVVGIPIRIRGGVYGFDDLRFRVAVGADTELGRLKALFGFLDTQPVRGAIHLQTLITGGVTDPLIRTAVASPRLWYGTIPLDDVHGVVDYERGGVTFTGVHTRFGPMRVTTSGNVDVTRRDAGIEAFLDAVGPGSAIPYAQAAAPDATIETRAVVVGSGPLFRAGGSLVASGPQSDGTGFVAVDERGRGEFGPFVFHHRDGGSLAGALRLERPRSYAAAWLDARGFRLSIPERVAAFPGVDIPPFPQVGGVIDASVVAGGPPNDFVVAGTVGARDAGFEHYRVGSADLALAGTLDDLRLQHVRVDGPIGHFVGGGAAAGGLFALTGAYDGSLQALEPFTGPLDARGPVRAPVLAVVDARGITVQTPAAAMAGSSIHGVPIGRAAGTLRIDPAGVRIVAADANVGGASAVAASTDDRVAISAIGIPASALAGAGLPLAAGRLSVFGVAGFAGPTFDGSVDLEHGRAPGGDALGGWADLDLAGSTLAVRQAVAALGDTYADVHGRLDGLAGGTPRYDLAATVGLGDVATLTRDLGLPVSEAEGTFAARLAVGGSGGAPTLTGRVRVPEGTLNGLSFTGAAGAVRIAAAGPSLFLDDGRVRVGGSAVAFSAAASPAGISFGAASPAVDLSDFDDFFDQSDLLTGSGPVAFRFSDAGGVVRTYGRIALDGARASRFPLGAVRAAWGMRGGRVVASLATSSASGGLGAGGTIAPAPGDPLDAFLRGRYDGSISVAGLDLGTWLPALGLTFPVSGRLDAAARAEGVPPRIALGGQASVTGGRLGPYPVTTASLRTSIAGDRVSIDDAQLDLGFARLTSSGTIGLGPGTPLNLRLHATLPDVGTAAARLTKASLDVGGALDADVRVGGSLTHPAIDAGIDLRDGRYGRFAVPRVVANLDSDLSVVRLQGLEMDFDHGSAAIAGSIPFTLSPFELGPSAAPLTLTAQANHLDLAPLAPLFPGSGTKLTGTVDGRIAVQGTVVSPRVYGDVALSGGSYVSDVLSSPVRDLNAGIRFEGTSVALQALHANVGAGSLDGSGRLDLPIAGIPRSGYAIDVTATGAQVTVPAYGGGTIDGTMTIVGGRREPVLSGDVTLSDTTIPFATIFKAAGASDEESGPLFDLGLDLHATAGRNVRVRSPIIDVGATGDVALTGSLRDPRAAGVLTATRGGVFSTYQRLFRITDATVTFDPAQGIVPNLDLHATTHVTNPDPDTTRNVAGAADIGVAVTGPADGYTVAFSSQPPYSQAQIIALLAAIPIIGTVNFNTPQVAGTLRGAPGEFNVLLPPGVTPYQGGVYSFQQEAFSLLNTQLTQRFVSPLENAFSGALGLTDLELTLDYGGRVGYTARKTISQKRQIDVTLGQVLSYPTRTQVGLTARPDAVTSASFSYFTQNGTPSYQNSIFGTTSTVQVLNGVQPLSNRQGFSAVLTRTYP